ncbi:hypothetical protein Leryth_008056 [Lithospermum erythrorhizon]|nr:hypothetical protein Leryth_008056 [Lithospermum erythrorhizon]
MTPRYKYMLISLVIHRYTHTYYLTWRVDKLSPYVPWKFYYTLPPNSFTQKLKLPEDILINILSRLPVKSILNCSMIGIFGALDSYDINIPFSDPSMRLVEFIDRVRWIPIIPSGNCDYYSVNGNCKTTHNG